MALILAMSLGCGKKDSTVSSGPGPGNSGGAGTTPVGIEGEYLVIGGEAFGEKMKEEEFGKDEAEKTVKITKDTIQNNEKGKLQSYKYTIDPSKSPAEIDITFPAKGKKPEISYGIYKLEGDTLTLFFMGSYEAKNRPKEFKTLKMDYPVTKDTKEPVGGLIFIILKRK
jgi:uncharacterized protein (TIGR03067 family)